MGDFFSYFRWRAPRHTEVEVLALDCFCVKTAAMPQRRSSRGTDQDHISKTRNFHHGQCSTAALETWKLNLRGYKKLPLLRNPRRVGIVNGEIAFRGAACATVSGAEPPRSVARHWLKHPKDASLARSGRHRYANGNPGRGAGRSTQTRTQPPATCASARRSEVDRPHDGRLRLEERRAEAGELGSMFRGGHSAQGSRAPPKARKR